MSQDIPKDVGTLRDVTITVAIVSVMVMFMGHVQIGTVGLGAAFALFLLTFALAGEAGSNGHR